jgi:hypothetical protein
MSKKRDLGSIIYDKHKGKILHDGDSIYDYELDLVFSSSYEWVTYWDILENKNPPKVPIYEKPIIQNVEYNYKSKINEYYKKYYKLTSNEYYKELQKQIDYNNNLNKYYQQNFNSNKNEINEPSENLKSSLFNNEKN